MAQFTCDECGVAFEVAEAALAKYPGWKPRFCNAHRKSKGAAPAAPAGAPTPWQIASGAAAPAIQRLPPGRAAGSKTWFGGGSGTDVVDLTPAEVLERFTQGPTDGVFTDGGARPNPGPGGWGFVYVKDGEIVAEDRGGERQTTNNRMELTAIIHALEHLPADTRTTVHSDSDLCVKTLTLWAKAWRARGWKRKDGEIKNLDLVQRAFELAQAHPGVKLQWTKAHDGTRWNEYADALATLGLKGK